MTYESYKSCVAPEGIYNGTQIREGDVITLQRGGTGFAAHDGKAVQAKRFFHMGPGSGKARTHPPACMQPAACFPGMQSPSCYLFIPLNPAVVIAAPAFAHFSQVRVRMHGNWSLARSGCGPGGVTSCML